MADEPNQPDPGDLSSVSRRDALRGMALVGGTLVWAVPVVQAFPVSAASGATTSPPPCKPRAQKCTRP